MAATKARAQAGGLKVRATPAPAAEEVRRVLAGRATEFTASGRVLFVSNGGRTIECRVPQHVNVSWMRAALAKGPVEAEAAVTDDGGEGSLWSVFPGPAHEGVLPDRLELAASESVRV